MEIKTDICREVWHQYEKGLQYNNSIDLLETVELNENFFIGKQWEGVQSNGLPTPVFNFLKRVVLFCVASVTSENIKLSVSPLPSTNQLPTDFIERVAHIVNGQINAIVENNNLISMLREMMRNAAVDGDGATHTYFDPDVETGQAVKGAIKTEIIENTRVFFGNPQDRRVQKQPYIIISSRELLDEVRERAKENGSEEWALIKPDNNDNTARNLYEVDDKVTVLLRYRRDRKTGKIFACECTKDVVVREEWDTGLTLYPITWLNWDYRQDDYHGQAMISGLIPNQIFINKLFAMSMISLMTTAYPKVVYDKTRIKNWNSAVGAAIGVNGGDVNNVAKILDPAQISPQIAQFIQLAVEMTQTFLGATSVALGDTRPDNTSAIVALQRAAETPLEITKHNRNQCVEDLGRIYIDFMREYYGVRLVEITNPQTGQKETAEFDFSVLNDVPLSLKLDVGASAYWSEIASMQTLDNLLMNGQIDVVDYLERVPDGYISKKQELIDKIKQAQMQAAIGAGAPLNGVNSPIVDFAQPPEITGGGGYRELQRAINETGVVQ
jgi:hypothetical protein